MSNAFAVHLRTARAEVEFNRSIFYRRRLHTRDQPPPDNGVYSEANKRGRRKAQLGEPPKADRSDYSVGVRLRLQWPKPNSVIRPYRRAWVRCSEVADPSRTRGRSLGKTARTTRRPRQRRDHL
jgi:hypothetical protein